VQKYVDDSLLADTVLAPLEKALVEIGHLGDVAVNCIVAEDGTPYPLEFTCRWGWPPMNIMLATHKGDPAQWMFDACEGKDTLQVSTDVACGIVIGQPDYPYSHAETEEDRKKLLDIPIYGPTSGNRRYVFPQSVKMAKLPTMNGDQVVEKTMWATCGDYVAVVTGTGSTVKKACKRAYKVIDEIEIPDMLYRDDIGEKLEEELPKLQAKGFATEFRYG
jgi:phosphoribosylamine-glycine ligase